jgi:hypothetical protein
MILGDRQLGDRQYIQIGVNTSKYMFDYFTQCYNYHYY